MSDAHGYPPDHDALLVALMEASTRARYAHDRDALTVLEAVLDHHQSGRMSDLARLIESVRPTPPVSDRALIEAAGNWAPAFEGSLGEEDFTW